MPRHRVAEWLQCNTVSEVLGVLEAVPFLHGGATPEQLASALHSLARWQRYRKTSVAEDCQWLQLQGEALRRRWEFGSRDLVAVAWALSDAGHSKGLELVIQVAAQQVETYNARELCRLAWCSVQLSQSGQKLLHQLAREIQRRPDTLSPLDASQLAWSMARLEYRSERLLVELQHHMQHQLHHCDGRHLANALWSFARLSFGDAPLISNLAGALTSLGSLPSTELSKCLWALGAMAVQCAAGDQLLQMAQAQGSQLGGQLAANVLWSAARLSCDRHIFRDLAGLCKECVGNLSVVHLGAIAWACAAFGGQGFHPNKRSGYRDAELLQLLDVAAGERCAELTPRLLTNFFWSFATLLWHRSQLYPVALQRVQELHPQEFAMLSWSWSTLDQKPWLLKLLMKVEKDDEKIGSLQLLKGHEVACLSWSLASLPTSPQFQGLRQAVQQHVLEQGSPGDQRGLAMLARSLVKLQLKEAFLHLSDQVQHQDLTPDLASALISGSVQLKDGREAALWAALPASPARAWRETELLRFVQSHVAKGDSKGVLAAVEEFCSSRRLWLKVAGGCKAQLLDQLLVATRPRRILEVGCYVGFSAVRFGCAVEGGGVCSVEMDPTVARVARQVVEHAGLEKLVTVHVGHSEEILPQLSGPFDVVFFDQRGSRFPKDLQLLCDTPNLLAEGAVLVADNVLKPGAPSFLWHLQTLETWRTCLVELGDFGSSKVLDWMSVSRRLSRSRQPNRPLQPPEAIDHLAWQADEMRWRSIESHVSPAEWNNFARYMKASLFSAGLRLPMRDLKDLETWLDGS